MALGAFSGGTGDLFVRGSAIRRGEAWAFQPVLQRNVDSRGGHRLPELKYFTHRDDELELGIPL